MVSGEKGLNNSTLGAEVVFPYRRRVVVDEPTMRERDRNLTGRLIFWSRVVTRLPSFTTSLPHRSGFPAELRLMSPGNVTSSS
jgi:hypothetical protein